MNSEKNQLNYFDHLSTEIDYYHNHRLMKLSLMTNSPLTLNKYYFPKTSCQQTKYAEKFNVYAKKAPNMKIEVCVYYTLLLSPRSKRNYPWFISNPSLEIPNFANLALIFSLLINIIFIIYLPFFLLSIILESS